MNPGDTVTIKRTGQAPRISMCVEVHADSHYGTVKVLWDDGNIGFATRDSLNRETPKPVGNRKSRHVLNARAGSKAGQ